jgi:hypothetical protein
MKSKNVVFFAILSSLVLSVPSFALVRELVACSTEDGRYTISIQDNQGIGPVRTSNPVAFIQDSQGDNEIVASFAVHQQLLQSISFGGHPTFVDNNSNGKKFTLAGPSTNFHNTRLRVTLKSGETLLEDRLICSIL